MESHPYKKITIAFGIAVAISFSAAAILFILPGDQSQLSDERQLAYDLQICQLDRQLGAPACYFDGEFIMVEDLIESGVIPP